MVRRLILIIIFAAVAVAALILHQLSRHKTAPLLQPIVATQPASQPATRHAPKPRYPTYLEIIRQQNTAVAATQPLDVPLELVDAAHVILRDPVYLDPTGNLWITRGDGQPAEKALAKPYETEDHIVRDKPVFVHWYLDDDGNWAAAMVVRNSLSGFDVITKTDRKHLADARNFRWNSAYSILGKIVVTTDIGVSVFDIYPAIQEHYHPLPGCDARSNPPVTLLDTRGVLAWSPWENKRTGSSGVCRFVDGNWIDLPKADWPARTIQLSMLLDGSVLCMSAGTPASTAPDEGVVENDLPDQFPDQVHLAINQLEPPQLDQKHIADLINQLSDTDVENRQAAYNELSRYGPELAPLLEKAGNDQLPEAQMRIKQLLRNKLTPALGGLMLVDNRLDVVRRCSDGTVIFFAPAGVQIPTEHDEPEVVNPAWLALRPDGRMERPLPPALIRDQKADACTLLSMHDDWVVSDDAGLRRLVGTGFVPLLNDSEKRFSELVGMATRRRWIFRDPVGQTLIIDPLIADPTPKLPVWTIVANKGLAGWDTDNFPAVSRGDQTGNWELDADGWKPLTPDKKLITQSAAPAASSAPTTTSTDLPLLIGSDGTKYFDGKTDLQMVKPSGDRTSWPLPAAAVGTSDPTLLQTADGLLFLFNQPGRLLRIRSTPTAAEPFKLEAVFTKDIPNTDHPARIWLDPAGRIVFVTNDNILSVAFPAGNIPREIARMMDDQP
jgi:hypothetical protein